MGRARPSGAWPCARGVVRACSLSLIVVSTGDDESTLGETLAALRQVHPSRVIQLQVTPGEARSLDGVASVQCWRPFGQPQQICCEQIRIAATQAALADLPPVLRGLEVPDLPVIVWLRDTDLIETPGMLPIIDLADKIVVNSSGCQSPRWIIDRLTGLHATGRLVADLSWTRLTRWRETVAQVFANSARRSVLDGIEEVTVVHYGVKTPVRALYLLAWLEQALGAKPAYRLSSAGDREPSQELGEVQGVSIRGRDLAISMEQLEGEAVELTIDGLVKHMVFHTVGDYELLREELSIEGPDPVFDAVLEGAARLATE